MFSVDPWPRQLLMHLAFVITIPIIVVGLSMVYERDICIVMLDWLQEFESKRVKPSPAAIGRLADGHQKPVTSR